MTSDKQRQVEKHQDEKRQAEQDKEARRRLNSVIGQQVMQTLGQPGDLLQVQVRRLWDNHYRVNILTGVNVASVKIANSYFLEADGAGNIVASVPKIARQY